MRRWLLLWWNEKRRINFFTGREPLCFKMHSGSKHMDRMSDWVQSPVLPQPSLQDSQLQKCLLFMTGILFLRNVYVVKAGCRFRTVGCGLALHIMAFIRVLNI